MRAATRRIFSYTRLDPVLRYFKPARDVRRTCFEWGDGELERIDERIFVYGVGTLHLHFASRGICLRGIRFGWKVTGDGGGESCSREVSLLR